MESRTNIQELYGSHERSMEVIFALHRCHKWSTTSGPLLQKAMNTFSSSTPNSPEDTVILERWNSPDDFMNGITAVGEVVAQSATKAIHVPGSDLMAEECVKAIESERTRHTADLERKDIDTMVMCKSLSGPSVIEAIREGGTSFLFDVEAWKKLVDGAKDKVKLQAEVVVFAHW
jgi:hypothetical protein